MNWENNYLGDIWNCMVDLDKKKKMFIELTSQRWKKEYNS